MTHRAWLIVVQGRVAGVVNDYKTGPQLKRASDRDPKSVILEGVDLVVDDHAWYRITGQHLIDNLSDLKMEGMHLWDCTNTLRGSKEDVRLRFYHDCSLCKYERARVVQNPSESLVLLLVQNASIHVQNALVSETVLMSPMAVRVVLDQRMLPQGWQSREAFPEPADREKKEGYPQGLPWLEVGGRRIHGDLVTAYHRKHSSGSYHCANCGAPLSEIRSYTCWNCKFKGQSPKVRGLT